MSAFYDVLLDSGCIYRPYQSANDSMKIHRTLPAIQNGLRSMNGH